MNTSHPGTKVGLLDLEINRIAKVLLYFSIDVKVLILEVVRSYVR
jgi:phospholipid-translocating ATPase